MATMSSIPGIDWERASENLAAGLAEEARRADLLERENAEQKREIERLKARIMLTKSELDGAKALYGALMDCQRDEITALERRVHAV